jgi:hypothetical protein
MHKITIRSLSMVISKFIGHTLITSLLTLGLIACGGGSGKKSANIGTLSGAPTGLSYKTSSGLSGTVDARGQYPYRTGDDVSFSLAGNVLSTIVAEPQLGIDQWLSNYLEDEELLALRLLISLDEDQDISNGLQLQNLDLSTALTNVDLTDLTQVTQLLQSIDYAASLVDASTAMYAALDIDSNRVLSGALSHLKEGGVYKSIYVTSNSSCGPHLAESATLTISALQPLQVNVQFSSGGIYNKTFAEESSSEFYDKDISAPTLTNIADQKLRILKMSRQITGVNSIIKKEGLIEFNEDLVLPYFTQTIRISDSTGCETSFYLVHEDDVAKPWLYITSPAVISADLKQIANCATNTANGPELFYGKEDYYWGPVHAKAFNATLDFEFTVQNNITQQVYGGLANDRCRIDDYGFHVCTVQTHPYATCDDHYAHAQEAGKYSADRLFYSTIGWKLNGDVVYTRERGNNKPISVPVTGAMSICQNDIPKTVCDHSNVNAVSSFSQGNSCSVAFPYAEDKSTSINCSNYPELGLNCGACNITYQVSTPESGNKSSGKGEDADGNNLDNEEMTVFIQLSPDDWSNEINGNWGSDKEFSNIPGDAISWEYFKFNNLVTDIEAYYTVPAKYLRYNYEPTCDEQRWVRPNAGELMSNGSDQFVRIDNGVVTFSNAVNERYTDTITAAGIGKCPNMSQNLTRCAHDNFIDYLTVDQVSGVSAADICLETLAGEILD